MDGRKYTVTVMLQLSATLINQPVMSLRTGGQVATTVTPILNPANLKIEGLYCDDQFEPVQLVLLGQDIRDRIGNGFVIDDHEVLVESEELIRLQNVLKVQFELIGKPVFTDKKKKLGKVVDYAVDGSALFVQKLYVGQNILKSINNGQLSIDRNQIVEISDSKIIVKDPLQGVKDSAPAALPA